MEHIPQSQAGVFQGESVTSYEYPTSNEHMNVALIKISGRYPEHGFTSNTLVESLIHVVAGRGTLGMEDGRMIEITTNDQVYLAIGDAYFFDGELEVVYAATPKWTPEQTLHT